MYQYLKQLSGTEQVAAMFMVVFGFLLLASSAAIVLSIRDHGDDAHEIGRASCRERV